MAHLIPSQCAALAPVPFFIPCSSNSSLPCCRAVNSSGFLWIPLHFSGFLWILLDSSEFLLPDVLQTGNCCIRCSCSLQRILCCRIALVLLHCKSPLFLGLLRSLAVDVEQESSPAMGWKMEILQIFNFPSSLNPLATISIQWGLRSGCGEAPQGKELVWVEEPWQLCYPHTDVERLNRALGNFNLLCDHLWNRSRQNLSFPLWQKELSGFSVLNIPSCSGDWAEECQECQEYHEFHLLPAFLCSASRAELWGHSCPTLLKNWINWGTSFLSRAGEIDPRIHRESWEELLRKNWMVCAPAQAAFKTNLRNSNKWCQWWKLILWESIDTWYEKTVVAGVHSSKSLHAQEQIVPWCVLKMD